MTIAFFYSASRDEHIVDGPSFLLMGGKPSKATTPPFHRPIIIAPADPEQTNTRAGEATVTWTRPTGAFTAPSMRPIVTVPCVEDQLSARPGESVISGGKPSGNITPPRYTATIVAPAEDQVTPSVFSSRIYGGIVGLPVTPALHRPILVAPAEDVHSRLHPKESVIYCGPVFKLPPGPPPATTARQDDIYLGFRPDATVLGGRPIGAVTPPIPQNVAVVRGPDTAELEPTPSRVMATIRRDAGVFAQPVRVILSLPDILETLQPPVLVRGSPVNTPVAPNIRISAPPTPDAADLVYNPVLLKGALQIVITPPAMKVICQPAPDIVDISQPNIITAPLKSGVPYIPVRLYPPTHPLGEEQLREPGRAILSTPIPPPVNFRIPPVIQYMGGEPLEAILQQHTAVIFFSFAASSLLPSAHPPTLLDPNLYIRTITISGSSGG